jgi:hypothetical protein
VLQRAKGFAHVAEFAQRGVELVGLRLRRRRILRRTPRAEPEVKDDEDDEDGEQGEGRDHWKRAEVLAPPL